MSEKWGSKMKWGDQDGEDDKDDSQDKNSQVFITPVDKDGVKTITELSVDDKGKTTKTVRKVKQQKKTVKVNKHVLERRKWAKFGDATGVPPGVENNITYYTHETIHLNLKPRKREDTQEEEEDDPFAKLKNDSIVICRLCGETGHWTLKCPKRESIVPKGQTAETAKEISKAPEEGTGKYVPVHLRNRPPGAAGSSSMEQRDDSTTIRVTNISAETTEDDLRDLFRRFGHTSRIFLAKDRNTGESRGFAYINYTSRDSAQKAIDRLDGYGYANLILRVEFAKPREDTPATQGAGGNNNAGWTMQGTR